MSLVFLTASFDITEDFHILHSAYKVTYTSVIPSLKQKLTTVSLTHTQTHQQLQTKSNWHVTSLAKGNFTGSDTPFMCEIPTTSSNKKYIVLLTLDWLWGRPQALLQRRNVSSVLVGLANDTKWMPSQNWGNLLSELHVSHRHCLAGIFNAFSASFTSIWLSFLRFYCTLNKACLLCATPAGTY